VHLRGVDALRRRFAPRGSAAVPSCRHILHAHELNASDIYVSIHPQSGGAAKAHGAGCTQAAGDKSIQRSAGTVRLLWSDESVRAYLLASSSQAGVSQSGVLGSPESIVIKLCGSFSALKAVGCSQLSPANVEVAGRCARVIEAGASRCREADEVNYKEFHRELSLENAGERPAF